MKIFNIILALLFALSAIVQINDPDPWLWVLWYALIAGICAFAAFKKYNQRLLLLFVLLGFIWMGSLVPEFVDWISKGAPSITGSMKAEEPHIEFTREFLGLLISIIVLLFHYFQSRKLNSS